jgi:hypothetical protein
MGSLNKSFHALTTAIISQVCTDCIFGTSLNDRVSRRLAEVECAWSSDETKTLLTLVVKELVKLKLALTLPVETLVIEVTAFFWSHTRRSVTQGTSSATRPGKMTRTDTEAIHALGILRTFIPVSGHIETTLPSDQGDTLLTLLIVELILRITRADAVVADERLGVEYVLGTLAVVMADFVVLPLPKASAIDESEIIVSADTST